MRIPTPWVHRGGWGFVGVLERVDHALEAHPDLPTERDDHKNDDSSDQCHEQAVLDSSCTLVAGGRAANSRTRSSRSV